ncbi:MAG: SxtJ family membrane protein [Omnitrophica bacterium]|nr:SxtJ family membrane protein [Candidatus Omnitrophota bacterium]
MLEDLKNIKSGKKELREFGLVVGGILLILGGLVFWRGRRELAPYVTSAGTALVILGLMLPTILKPLQKVWMGFSVIMGFFVSRVILFILFYAVLTPLGLVARLFGKDILNQKIDKSTGSYWCDRNPKTKSKESYENQY